MRARSPRLMTLPSSLPPKLGWSPGDLRCVNAVAPQGGRESPLLRTRHLEAGEGLADGHQLQPIDVEVRRQFGHPQHRRCDIIACHWVHAAIERLRSRLVA